MGVCPGAQYSVAFEMKLASCFYPGVYKRCVRCSFGFLSNNLLPQIKIIFNENSNQVF